MGTTTNRAGENEVTLLARVLGNEHCRLPVELARYILKLGFSEQEKARMHDLAVRNPQDGLSPAEKEELYGFAKAGSLLSIPKSRARRTLHVKPKKGSAT
jgi:hypothetical protein